MSLPDISKCRRTELYAPVQNGASSFGLIAVDVPQTVHCSGVKDTSCPDFCTASMWVG